MFSVIIFLNFRHSVVIHLNYIMKYCIGTCLRCNFVIFHVELWHKFIGHNPKSKILPLISVMRIASRSAINVTDSWTSVTKTYAINCEMVQMHAKRLIFFFFFFKRLEIGVLKKNNKRKEERSLLFCCCCWKIQEYYYERWTMNDYHTYTVQYTVYEYAYFNAKIACTRFIVAQFDKIILYLIWSNMVNEKKKNYRRNGPMSICHVLRLRHRSIPFYILIILL